MRGREMSGSGAAWDFLDEYCVEQGEAILTVAFLILWQKELECSLVKIML